MMVQHDTGGGELMQLSMITTGGGQSVRAASPGIRLAVITCRNGSVSGANRSRGVPVASCQYLRQVYIVASFGFLRQPWLFDPATSHPTKRGRRK